MLLDQLQKLITPERARSVIACLSTDAKIAFPDVDLRSDMSCFVDVRKQKNSMSAAHS